MKEKMGLKSRWLITKFNDPDGAIAEALRRGASLDELRKSPAFLGEEVEEGNVTLLEGRYLISGLITGIDTSTPKWDAANARIGVGDSATAEDKSHTGLQGTNKAFNGMDSGYPKRASSATDDPQFIEWRSTFGPTEANFHWQEFTVVNGEDDTGVNLNRKVADKGTKESGETWTITLRLEFEQP